jgi:hypothetical protein
MTKQNGTQPPGNAPAMASAVVALAALAYLLAFSLLAPALSVEPLSSGSSLVTSAFGLVAIGGLALSLLGMVLGGVGVARSTGRRRLSVLGLLLNLMLFLLFVAALVAHPGPVT